MVYWGDYDEMIVAVGETEIGVFEPGGKFLWRAALGDVIDHIDLKDGVLQLTDVSGETGRYEAPTGQRPLGGFRFARRIPALRAKSSTCLAPRSRRRKKWYNHVPMNPPARIDEAPSLAPAEKRSVPTLDEIRRAAETLEALVADPEMSLTEKVSEAEHGVRLMISRGASLSRAPRSGSSRRSPRRHAQREAQASSTRPIAPGRWRPPASAPPARAAVFVAPAFALARAPDAPCARPDRSRTGCYVCKQPFTRLHHYYDNMCSDCGDFNYAKRFQTADMSGRTAYITGARLKIGYQAAL